MSLHPVAQDKRRVLQELHHAAVKKRLEIGDRSNEAPGDASMLREMQAAFPEQVQPGVQYGSSNYKIV